jgi:hypothetical protein
MPVGRELWEVPMTAKVSRRASPLSFVTLAVATELAEVQTSLVANTCRAVPDGGSVREDA